MSENELQPDTPEVLQVEDPAGIEPEVRVRITNQVRNQALPSKAGATRTITANPLPASYQVLHANPRRRQSLLVAPNPFLVAYNRASAQDASMMALWPANVPLPVTGVFDVFVAAPTGTVSISVVSEYWATGEGGE